MKALRVTSAASHSYNLALDGIVGYWPSDIEGMSFVQMSRAGWDYGRHGPAAYPILIHGTPQELDAAFSAATTEPVRR